MFPSLILLSLGFASNLASAFTTAYSQRWGGRRGSVLSIILRDILGIPVWAVGFVLAYLKPSLLLIAPAAILESTGRFLIISGSLVILVALITIRFRAAAPSTQDPLVQNGLYACIRHPFHTGTIFEFLGSFLTRPSQSLGIACALGIGWVLIQTRFEEYDLLQRLPDYREYMDRVRRFFPHIIN